MSERALLIEVLNSAFSDLTNPRLSLKQMGAPVTPENVVAVQDLARDWITSELTDPFSFLWVCDQLGYQAAVLRAQLLRFEAK